MVTDINHFNKANYRYTPLFCEENIWKLIASLTAENISINRLHCLFLINPEQKVVLNTQLAVPAGQWLSWDYHVILLANIRYHPVIFDFDSRLDFACPLEHYLSNTFIFSDSASNEAVEEFTTYIKKIPALSYRKHFYSDRSHMQGHVSSNEYPSWPIINEHSGEQVPLADYLSMTQGLESGSRLIKVDSLASVVRRLSD